MSLLETDNWNYNNIQKIWHSVKNIPVLYTQNDCQRLVDLRKPKPNAPKGSGIGKFNAFGCLGGDCMPSVCEPDDTNAWTPDLDGCKKCMVGCKEGQNCRGKHTEDPNHKIMCDCKENCDTCKTYDDYVKCCIEKTPDKDMNNTCKLWLYRCGSPSFGVGPVSPDNPDKKSKPHDQSHTWDDKHLVKVKEYFKEHFKQSAPSNKDLDKLSSCFTAKIKEMYSPSEFDEIMKKDVLPTVITNVMHVCSQKTSRKGMPMIEKVLLGFGVTGLIIIFILIGMITYKRMKNKQPQFRFRFY